MTRNLTTVADHISLIAMQSELRRDWQKLMRHGTFLWTTTLIHFIMLLLHFLWYWKIPRYRSTHTQVNAYFFLALSEPKLAMHPRTTRMRNMIFKINVSFNHCAFGSTNGLLPPASPNQFVYLLTSLACQHTCIHKNPPKWIKILSPFKKKRLLLKETHIDLHTKYSLKISVTLDRNRNRIHGSFLKCYSAKIQFFKPATDLITTQDQSLLVGISSTAGVMLKVTGIRRIHNASNGEKKASSEGTCYVHTQQDTTFKAICYSEWDAKSTPLLAIKDIPFKRCVIWPYMHHMYGVFRLFENMKYAMKVLCL